MIAVIIPFYQRRPGLLRRAVQSVIDQDSAIPWHIIVVDDGSPAGAREELASLDDELEGRLTVVLNHGNSGVSAARNRGLDHVPPDTDTVAFLDSDDAWECGHLRRVATAMAAGADFYFENFHRYDGKVAGLSGTAMDWERCAKFEPQQELYWFEGDFFDALLKGSPARTSTVACRFERSSHVRFRESLSCGEDIFFWMEVSLGARRIAMSPSMGAYCGKGVNISEHAWGTLGEVRHHFGAARYMQAVRARFSLTEEQKRWTDRVLRELDMNIWQSALAAGMRGRYAGAGLALSHMAKRPQAISRFPAAMVKAAQRKLSRLPDLR